MKLLFLTQGLVSLVNADLRAQLEPLAKMVFQAMQELLARMVLMAPLVAQASLANQVNDFVNIAEIRCSNVIYY